MTPPRSGVASVPDTFDVTVVGSGVAGSLCAGALAEHGLRVCLTDALRASRNRPAEILAPPTLRLLRRIVGDEVVFGGDPYRGVLSRWSGDEPDYFDYELLAFEAALAVDRASLDAQLQGWAVGRGAILQSPCRVVRVHDQICGDDLEVDAIVSTVPRRWRTTFLVDASGRSGSLPIGSRDRHSFFDRLIALVTVTEERPAASRLLLLEATRHGWWYIAVAADTRLVMLSDQDLSPRCALARGQWLQEEYLNTTVVRNQFGAMPAFEEHRCLDARTSRREALAGGRVIRIGDAVWTNDPLSGSGILFAAESADRAAQAIVDWFGRRTASMDAFAGWCTEKFREAQAAGREVYGAVRPDLRGERFWARRREETLEVARAADAPRG